MSAWSADALMLRQCCVRLRRCDPEAGGPRPEQLRPAWPRAAQAEDFPIKCEVGAAGTPIKQELDLEPSTMEPWTMARIEAEDTPIKCEVGADGTLIRQDIEIGPTLVQPRTVTHPQLQTAESAPSARRQPPSANAPRTPTPLHCDRESTQVLFQPTPSRHIPEEPILSKSSSVSDMTYGLSDKKTSTTQKICKRNFVGTRNKVNKKLFECDHCQYSTSLRRNIQRHMLRHMKKRPYKCEHCQYSTSLSGNIQRHMRRHTGERPYKCKHCDYSASRNEHLQMHILTHTGKKPYKCKHCDYSASRSGNLKMHMFTHTGEKPYKCELCDYSAARNGNLQTHMRTHTGEKPYKCEHCDYSACSNHLRNHMRKHTGEKPYRCKYCDYGVSRKSTLIKHMHIHTRNKLYK